MAETTDHADRRLVSFVLPVYDEQDSLEELHRQITERMKLEGEDYELLFVDDGSTDESFDVLSRLQQADEAVRVVRFRKNFGKAAAYSAGFDYARGSIVITMDTDLQDSADDVPLFIAGIDEGADLVVGWKHRGKGPIGKSFPSRFFNRVVSWVTKMPLHDFNCPFKAYRSEVLGEIDVHGELHRYIPVLAAARGFSVTEVKISNLPRQHGHSKYGMERYFRGMLDLITVIFVTRFSKRPLHLLGGWGIAAFALGFLILLLLMGAHIMYSTGVLSDPSWNIHDRPALSLGILMVIFGTQFLSIGLIGELIVTNAGSKGSAKGYSIRQVLQTGPSDRGRP